MDDRRDEMLDIFLSEDLSGVSDIMGPEPIDPWHRPVMLIVWGIVLTTLKLNFFMLQYILPAVGMGLLYLGFRALRLHNRGFGIAWRITQVRTVLSVLTTALTAFTPIGEPLGTILGVPLSIIQVAQLIALRSGIKTAYRDADCEREGDPVLGLIICQIVLIVLALLNMGGIFAVTLIIAYIPFVISARKLARGLGDAGYSLQIAPVKVNDNSVLAIYCGVCFAVAASFSVLGAHSPQKASPAEETGLQAERQALIELGFTEDILADIPDEYVKEFAGALNVQTWNDARDFDRYENYRGYMGATDETVLQGENVLRTDTVYVELEDNMVYVVQYFQWLSGGAYWSDGIDIWVDNNTVSFELLGGGLLYEKGGESLTAPIKDLTMGGAVRTSVFFGESTYRSINGSVSYPFGAENQRGYVVYKFRVPDDDIAITCGSLDYLHRALPPYPAKDPAQQIRTGDYNYRDRMQNYTTYDMYGELYWQLAQEGER